MRGVILSGGLGTRMREFTAVSNKHLAPVYTEEGATPMIFYPIRTLVNSGIDEILIISSQEHSGHIIEYLGDGSRFNADFTYKIQDMNKKPAGIASALKIAKPFTRDDPFVVVLGDNFFEDTLSFENIYSNLANYDACVFLKEVPDIQRFGCAELNNNNEVISIEEKPINPKSNWAVTGLYCYTKHVYSIIDDLTPSNRGELEVTDINDFYAKNKTLKAVKLQGFWSDMGTPKSMLRTQEFLAKR